MKTLIAALMLISTKVFAFNGEIETPTFALWRFNSPAIKAHNVGDQETGLPGHTNPASPFVPPPFGAWGKAVYIPSPQYVKTFLSHSVFIGDSITQGWDLKTYFGVPVVNQGIGGQTTYQMLARFNQVLSLNPQGVFILAGINDIARLYPLAGTEKNIATMVTEADAIHAAVFVGTLIPAVPANGTQNQSMPLEVNQFNAWLKGYCNGTNCTMINYNKAAGGPGYSFADHLDYIHPNNLAYIGMSRMVIHAIERSIGHAHNGACRHR